MDLTILNDVAAGTKFFLRLPPLLRNKIKSGEAHAIHQERLDQRETNFLAVARHRIYNNPESPYRVLLALAGCEYEDLEALVTKEGVEGALQRLYLHGVYFTVDEFRGNSLVRRGGKTFEVTSAQFRNPSVTSHIMAQTSGSRGRGTQAPVDLALVREHAVDLFLDFEARGGLDWVRAVWSVPGAGALRRMIGYSLCGAAPARWFSLVDPSAPGLHPRYFWSSRALRWAGLLAGSSLPLPVAVSLRDPMPIVRWMVEVIKSGRIPHLYAYASCAVRVCQAALDSGMELRGAQFMTGGEPTTTARLAVIRRVGAAAQIHYGAQEAGGLGRSCLMPEFVDDVHFLEDRYALVQRDIGGRSNLLPQTLLISTLLPRARLVLLNVSLGDQATVVKRHCGCPLEKLGLKTHLHTIRSFEKLTAGGVTFLDTDVIRVLEDVLPARFGGAPTDFQLVDESTGDGVPRVRLLVNPRLGPLDSDAVRQAFLEGIGEGSGVERVMMLTWRDAGLPIVEREAPKLTGGGKIQHVHFGRAKIDPPAER